MKIKNLINWKIFRLLLFAGILGTVAVFPYLITTQVELFKDLSFDASLVLLLSLFQSTVILSLAIFIGLLLGKKIGFDTPLLSKWVKRVPVKEELKSKGFIGIKLGILAGVLIISLDYVFLLFMEPVASVKVPIWQGFLASFYGGIVEEILLRFFLVTLLVWILWKISKMNDSKVTPSSVWVAIVVAAVVFGLGHLPATAALTTITPLVIFRALLLNGIGGLIFGWLFWKKGIETAIISHFSADLVLLVFFPLILSIF